MNDARLSDALAALDGADVASASSAECVALLQQARLARGWVDAVEATITSRMRELYETTGAAPAADQHTRCGGVSSAEGRRKERRSQAIDEAPSFGDALAAAEIGAEHVDALANATSKLDDDTKSHLLGDEAELLDDARSMSPERFGRRCRDRVRQLERDAGIERNRRQRRQTFLSRKQNPATGMVEGRFALHPELADQVFGAVDAEVVAMLTEGEQAGDPECIDRTVDRSRLAAEALGRLVVAGSGGSRQPVADIVYLVDERTATTGELHEDSVCETGSGLPVPPSSVRQGLCNGRIVPIIVDRDGNALDAGRTIRHAGRTQRRALRAMYRTCAVGECDVPFERCEIHHIVPWEVGGATDLANLVPACSRHHHLIHELDWRLDLRPDRTLDVTGPDGTPIATGEPDVPPQRRRPNRRRRPAA